jgi:hypothetical protein
MMDGLGHESIVVPNTLGGPITAYPSQDFYGRSKEYGREQEPRSVPAGEDGVTGYQC